MRRTGLVLLAAAAGAAGLGAMLVARGEQVWGSSSLMAAVMPAWLALTMLGTYVVVSVLVSRPHRQP